MRFKKLIITIQKEAICIKTDFQNLSGGACHQNNRFGQSHSSSLVHTMKTKHFFTLLIHRRLLTSICMVDCLTFHQVEMRKHAILVMRCVWLSIRNQSKAYVYGWFDFTSSIFPQIGTGL